MDRELGELEPETLDLLESWLEEHPESTAPVPSIRRTLAAAAAAMHRFPELARPEITPAQPQRFVVPLGRFRLAPLAMAASVLALLGLGTWIGFRAGQESAQHRIALKNQRPIAAHQTPTVRRADPWTHYAWAPAPQGGLTLIRKPQS